MKFAYLKILVQILHKHQYSFFLTKMDNAKASELLQHLYLNGVRPNGRDIGVGAYGRVFEVEFCGTIYAWLLLLHGTERNGTEHLVP